MKRTCLVLALIALSGCSSYSETFDCPAGLGVGCKSLSRVNQMVENGDLPHKDPEDSTSNNEIRPRFVKSNPTEPLHLNADFKATTKTNRIWLAGHKDKKGHYHEAHYVEPVTKEREG